MWRHHQNTKPRVPHLSGLPSVLPPQPEVRVADPGPGALPEDHDQLQPPLRPGGSRLQVSAGAALRSATAPPAGLRRPTPASEGQLRPPRGSPGFQGAPPASTGLAPPPAAASLLPEPPSGASSVGRGEAEGRLGNFCSGGCGLDFGLPGVGRGRMLRSRVALFATPSLPACFFFFFERGSEVLKSGSPSFCVPTATGSLWQKRAPCNLPALFNAGLVWHLLSPITVQRTAGP